jgi:hypothetical protein
MGWSIRAFLVDEAGEIQRFPYARFKRLWDGEPAEKMPDFAGQFLCVAIAYIETHNRRPLCIRHVDYLRIKLDKKGRIAKDWIQSSMRLAADSVDWSWLQKESAGPKNLIAAGHLFSRKRYKHEHSWEPTKPQEDEILNRSLM